MKEFNAPRPTRAASSEPLAHTPNAALLIDFDNVTMGIRSDLQNQLRKLLQSDVFKGKVSVQRAYADWRRYPQYIVPLSEASVDLIFAPAFGSNKKNATDIRLAIDALELVFTRPEIGIFILLSGDSDFSSLVLKLKEYAKYVIGVGIRESSSDLLIQNCDEYYSYNELTGLAREGEGEHQRRDPWDLVVAALTRMKERSDVMRSDRMKQVMQEIDPTFDEKDAGFNRFSKFMLEAGKRGLVRLRRMENGQYEVDLGANANVSPEVEAGIEAEAEAAVAPAAKPRRKRAGRDRVECAAAGRGITLADAFALLKKALGELGAVGEESADAGQVRERMLELRDGDADPVLDGARFQRFLRQAHDADVIDLVKQDDDVYLLRLRPEPEAGDAPTAQGSPEAPSIEAPPVQGAAEPRRRSPTGRRKKAASGTGERRKRAPRKPAARKDEGNQAAKAPEPEGQAESNERRSGVGFRSGSRKPIRRARTEGSAEPTATDSGTAAKPTPVPPPRESDEKRSVRSRAGSRGRPPPPAATKEDPPTSSGPSVPDNRALGGDTRSTSADTGPRAQAAAKPPPTTEVAETEEGGSSLLKRMTAALQKVVMGEDPAAPREGG